MTKLKYFIVAQVIFGVLVGFNAVPYNFLFTFIFIGLVASHISLLGIWTGIDQSVRWERLLCFLAVVAELCVAAPFHFVDILGTVLSLFVVIVGVAVMTSFLMRRFGVQLQLLSDEEQVSPTPKMQFTLRDLFVVTFCAALFLSVGKVHRDSQGAEMSSILYFLEVLFAITLTTFLCMWAAMSRASPLLPTVITIVAVLLMSLVFNWSMGGTGMGIFWWELGMNPLSYFIWTLATLLVVRSYGYRITSKKAPTKTV